MASPRLLIVLFAAFVFVSSAAHAAPSKTSPEKGGDFEDTCRGFLRAKGKKNDSARLKELFDIHWAYLMTTYPEWATYVGYPGQNGRWTDRSLESIEARERDALCLRDMLRSIDARKLTSGDALNHSLLLESTELGIEGSRFPSELLAVNQLSGIQLEMARLLSDSPKKTEQDYRDLLSRLKGAGRVLDQTMTLLKRGLEQKVTPPRITLRDVPSQFQSMIADDPMKSPLMASFNEIPESIPSARADEIRAEAVAIYRDQLKPRLQGMVTFLKDVYVPQSREDVSFRALPDGAAWYAFRAKEYTTTDLTPRQIHEIGLAEVARIRAEMGKVAKEAGHKGSLESFETMLRTDKRFKYESAEQLLDGYRVIGKKADPELVKLFGRLPRTPWGVKAIPPYQEKSAPAAYYLDGSLEVGRAGFFQANTYNVASRLKWEMEALTLHEAVPGHHLQIALAQEMENQPEFRKNDGYTAFVEGWALYAESLGYEMGLYQDPYSKYGQLAYEMWRALRLVVDTGLHELGWTREQAIQYMLKNVGKSEHDITVEVDRYIVWGGQALAYKIGQLKIKELRETATKELGTRFDIRRFHDVVLGSGALPLNVLARRIDAWIATERKAASSGGR